jgi:cell division protein FtsX
MFFINILLVLHNVSLELIDSINSKLTISLYLNDKYDKDSVEVMDFKSDIDEKLSNIKYIYKTKEEILEDMEKRDPELVKIIERTNPLPETIILSNINLDQYKVLNNIIENKLFILSNIKE